MGGSTSTGTWRERFAAFAYDSFHGDIPSDVLERAALQLLDSIGCAAGAHDAPPVEVVQRVTAGSGPEEATLLFRGRRASVVDAILANGTAVRFLDANDVFIGLGPGGHPSDNIAVVLAVAEQAGASGRDALAAIAMNYELVWRLRTSLLDKVPRGKDWDGVSVAGPVAAAISALLMGADRQQLADAIAIGAAKGYALKEIRHGVISMLKGSGNAVVAREGALAARMAMAGMTGPGEVFEGRSGLVRTLGGEPDDGMLEALCAPAEWVLRNISVKPFPAIGTSQSALSACQLLHAAHDYEADDIERVTLRLPDSEWTREYQTITERHWPESRESADHCIPFLVVMGLLEGGVLLEHYDNERWREPGVLKLMERTTIVPDERLAGLATTSYPTIVEVELADGRTISQEMIDTPGSPRNPWGREEILAKWRRLDRTGVSTERAEQVADAVLGLPSAPDLKAVAEAVRDPA